MEKAVKPQTPLPVGRGIPHTHAPSPVAPRSPAQLDCAVTNWPLNSPALAGCSDIFATASKLLHGFAAGGGCKFLLFPSTLALASKTTTKYLRFSNWLVNRNNACCCGLYSVPCAIMVHAHCSDVQDCCIVCMYDVRNSGIAIQVASGAYAPPVSKIHNIFGMWFLKIFVCMRIYA